MRTARRARRRVRSSASSPLADGRCPALRGSPPVAITTFLSSYVSRASPSTRRSVVGHDSQTRRAERSATELKPKNSAACPLGTLATEPARQSRPQPAHPLQEAVEPGDPAARDQPGRHGSYCRPGGNGRPPPREDVRAREERHDS